VLAAGFAELAAQLGVRDLQDSRNPVTSVHAVLAAYPAEWLLIFDNAPDAASLATVLPPAGRGKLVITSQNPQWAPSQTLEVPFLDLDVAAGFLVNRTSDQDWQTAIELANELGGLPLALEQAAAYLQASGANLAYYLTSFRRRRPEMMARGNPIGYGKTVAATWNLSFEQLERSAPRSVAMLRLLAFCSPDAIPLDLLLRPRPEISGQLDVIVAPLLDPLLQDRLAATDAIADLRRYSLISRPADWIVSVHRLVQAVTMDQLPPEVAASWRRTAALLIKSALPANPSQPSSWPAYAALLPHAHAALAADSDGIELIASYLGYRGSYGAARELQQNLFAIREEKLGPEHPDTLKARAKLAYWTGAAGDAASARDQYAILLPLRVQAIGAEHPDTLTTRKDLARWTGAAGDAPGARDQYAALLPIVERLLGPEDYTALTILNDLAAWTGWAGNATEARERFAALLPVVERVLGPEHPDTLAAHNNLAYWTSRAGDAVGSRDQYAALLPIIERVLGPEHPKTLITRGNLARSIAAAGDVTEARRQYRELLPIMNRVLGQNHPNAAAIKNDLSRWFEEAGDDTGDT